MKKSLIHSRSFRIPIREEDEVKLKMERLDNLGNVVFSKELNNIKTKVLDISLTGMSFDIESNNLTLQASELFLLHISFEDFYLSLKGEVVRHVEKEDKITVAVKFQIEEGQTFDILFKKFIKTFDSERVRSQLVNLISEQSDSEFDENSILDLTLNLHSQIEKYSELEKFHDTLILQWKHNLSSDLVLCISPYGETPDGFKFEFEYNSEEYSIVVNDSILIDCLNEKKTISALIYNDEFIMNISEITGKNILSFVVMPVIDNKEVMTLLLFGRSNMEKYNDSDLLLINQAAEQIATSLLRKSKISTENVKYLNPDKPRQFAMVGNDEKIQNLRRLIEGTKMDNRPVLLTGSRGTGKKLMAQIIHSESRLSHREFLHLDATRKNHLEKIDKILSSNKIPLEFNSFGTIFITNIHKLDKKKFELLQENALDSLNEVRFIISPGVDENLKYIPENILKKVGNNKFHMPDLKERKDDIPNLIKYLLKIECKKRGYLEKTIDEKVLESFLVHDWDGNIREIKTAIGRIVEYYSNKSHIDKLPPDSYHLFSIRKNTDYGILGKMQRIKSVMDENALSREEMSLYFQREIILAEVDKHEGSLKKAALSLGKPLQHLESILEQSSALIDANGLSEKKAI